MQFGRPTWMHFSYKSTQIAVTCKCFLASSSSSSSDLPLRRPPPPNSVCSSPGVAKATDPRACTSSMHSGAATYGTGRHYRRANSRNTSRRPRAQVHRIRRPRRWLQRRRRAHTHTSSELYGNKSAEFGNSLSLSVHQPTSAICHSTRRHHISSVI